MKSLFFRLLALPSEPPEAPLGSGHGTRAFRASKKYLILRLLGSLIGIVSMLFFAFVFFASKNVSSEGNAVVSWLANLPFIFALLASLSAFFSAYIDYSLRYYIVTDKSVRIREGVFFLKESTFTIENIQNVRLHQGFLSRLLRLYDVIIETAGGGGAVPAAQAGKHMAALAHQGVLRGIENGEDIRSFIAKLAKEVKSSGLGDEREDVVDPRPSSAQERASLIALIEELRETERLTRPSC